MIKFFGHIRKSLLMENKTGKYLKYAIGEIIPNFKQTIEQRLIVVLNYILLTNHSSVL